MSRWKPDEIFELLRHCGAIALAYGAAPATEQKSDHSVVTQADREIEEFLATRFDRPALGSYLIGEETVGRRDEAYLEAALRSTCYVVDPIDGTAPFSLGLPLWGISIGLMESGVLTEGAFYLPVQDEAFLTCRGTVWRARKLQSGTPEVTPFDSSQIPTPPEPNIAISQSLAKHGSFDLPDYQVFAWATCVACYYFLLTGKLAACLQHCKLWDLAGGMPVLLAAGFKAEFPDGQSFRSAIIREEQFELDAAAQQRWRLRDHLLLARDHATIAHIVQHANLN